MDEKGHPGDNYPADGTSYPACLQDDPPGKLALLYDLERVAALLRDGNEPFHPDRDRVAFARHLIDLGCQPPPGR
ncbi:MAG: hypothetical protein ACR2IP_03465 [Solirubrobacteraceae bacterium]